MTIPAAFYNKGTGAGRRNRQRTYRDGAGRRAAAGCNRERGCTGNRRDGICGVCSGRREHRSVRTVFLSAGNGSGTGEDAGIKNRCGTVGGRRACGRELSCADACNLIIALDAHGIFILEDKPLAVNMDRRPGCVEKSPTALACIDDLMTDRIDKRQAFDVARIGIGRICVDDTAGKFSSAITQDVRDIFKRQLICPIGMRNIGLFFKIIADGA